MTKVRALEIIYNLNQTLSKMGKSNGIHSDLAMFKGPRAKRSDLVKKKNELIKKYNL